MTDRIKRQVAACLAALQASLAAVDEWAKWSVRAAPA